MNQTEELPYVDDGKAQIVALPLVGGQLSVVFALPARGPRHVRGGAHVDRAAAVGQQQVAISLPKFAFTSPTFSLAQPLQAMGMVQAFDPQAAQFQGMCSNPPDGDNLYVADVLQKAMVAVQETGIEAAAATAVRHGRRVDRRSRSPSREREPAVRAGNRRRADGSHALPRAHRGPDRRGDPVVPGVVSRSRAARSSSSSVRAARGSASRARVDCTTA